MDAWRSFSIEDELARLSPFPVTLCNDATSACAAELFFGDAWRRRDFLYFFVGTFIGGGLVIDGALFPGRTGNAAAVGSMPIATTDRNGDATSQLIDSRLDLSARTADRRRPGAILLDLAHAGKMGRFRPPARRMDRQGGFRACLCDGDGDFGHRRPGGDHRRRDAQGGARTSHAQRWRRRSRSFDRRGLSDVTIAEGAIGADARAIGGAALPLIKTFARDREVLFKDALTESA